MKKAKTKINEAASLLGKRRWAGVTKEEMSEQQSKTASLPRVEQRCFCGANSMWRAANRYFDCCRKAGVVTVNLERRKENR